MLPSVFLHLLKLYLDAQLISGKEQSGVQFSAKGTSFMQLALSAHAAPWMSPPTG